MPTSKPARALSDAQIEQFIQDGFQDRSRLSARTCRTRPRHPVARPALRSPEARDLDTASHPPRLLRRRTIQESGQQPAASYRLRPARRKGTLVAASRPRHIPRAISESARSRRRRLACRSQFPGRRPTYRQQRLRRMEGQRDVARTRATDAVPVLRCGRVRRAHPNKAGLASRYGALSRTGRRGRHVAFEAGRDGKQPARDTGDRRRRHSLSVPPVPRSRRANAPGIRATFHGAAAAAPV